MGIYENASGRTENCAVESDKIEKKERRRPTIKKKQAVSDQGRKRDFLCRYRSSTRHPKLGSFQLKALQPVLVE
jgi:hypothetical protein